LTTKYERIGRFIRAAPKRHGRVEESVIDGLRSNLLALNDHNCGYRRRVVRSANNPAENRHLPFRRREAAMQCFRSMQSLQKFISVHASACNLFNLERHLISRHTFKLRRATTQAASGTLPG
jgi:putative transposase